MVSGRAAEIARRLVITYDTPDGTRTLSSSTRNSPALSRIRSMPDTCTRTPLGGRTVAASRW
jgi:hypothetical protein